MDIDERLDQAFERGLEDGIEALSDTDRELFFIQDFIVEYEMNGLSGFFYNRLPDIQRIDAAIAAMNKHGFAALGNLLDEATAFFRGADEFDDEGTWGDVLRKRDPNSRLEAISNTIDALDDYGFENASS